MHSEQFVASLEAGMITKVYNVRVLALFFFVFVGYTNMLLIFIMLFHYF
jgi:hypothetical protein